jgi:hypothetical protein
MGEPERRRSDWAKQDRRLVGTALLADLRSGRNSNRAVAHEPH